MLISIVIPTHNRPEMLLEAIESITTQNYKQVEIVVVDDGSNPPISAPTLRNLAGDQIVFVRHEAPKGVPKAKNSGITIARGEVILLLDDDDLLTDNALETISRAYALHPSIDCLFLGAIPFGQYSPGPARNRELALRKVFDLTTPSEQDEIYFFSDGLFDALLQTVPIDFQRPAARRGFWNIAGAFDESGLYSESAWAIRASTTGVIALLKNPVSMWRIHDRNFGWPGELSEDQMRRRQNENSLANGEQLLRVFGKKRELACRQYAQIKKHNAENLFSMAYQLCNSDSKQGAYYLFTSFRLMPRWKHIKLLTRIAATAVRVKSREIINAFSE